MRDLNYRSPLDADGRRFAPWLLDLLNGNGCYAVRDRETHRCLYVGMSKSSCLSKTIRRHFHRWRDDAGRKHFTYDRRRVQIAVRLCPPDAVPGAERNLIARLNPRDNGNGWPAEKPF